MVLASSLEVLVVTHGVLLTLTSRVTSIARHLAEPALVEIGDLMTAHPKTHWQLLFYQLDGRNPTRFASQSQRALGRSILLFKKVPTYAIGITQPWIAKRTARVPSLMV
jgi:hypothetical protein